MSELIGRYVQVGPYRIYYESMGSGEPVICLPTAGASTGEYRNVLPALAQAGYFAIAMDPPGHGNSYPDLKDLSVPATEDAYVDLVWAFAQKLDLNRPVFVGCAMSGSAMLLLALKHGREIRAVVAGEGNASFRINPIQLAALDHPSINMADMMESTTAGVCARGIEPAVLNECIWHNARNASPSVIFADLNIYDQHDLESRLGEIPCPVLHLYGEEDPCVLEQSKRLLREQVPQIRQVALPHTGHLSPVENPAGFSAAIIQFLQELPVQDERGARS